HQRVPLACSAGRRRPLRGATITATRYGTAWTARFVPSGRCPHAAPSASMAAAQPPSRGERMPLHQEAHPTRSTEEIDVRPQFCRPGETGTVPRFRMPERSMSPETAYQIVHDELMLDGNARLNVATFVTTWMEPVADVLMAECSSKNMIDKDEYPQTAELEMRCLNMLADLWGSTDAGGGRATGCSTTGSSEACMLGGMALKWRWRERRRTTGRPAEAPNLVM